MTHASVTKVVRPGVTQRIAVKNLGWFFRKARTTVIDKFDLWESNDGWEMFVDFADGSTFHTPYASLTVFKHVMKKQRSLRGVVVTLYDRDGGTARIKLAKEGMIGRAEGDHGGKYDWMLV